MNAPIAVLAIAGAIAVGAASPGPSFVMVVRTAIAKSRRDGIAAALGMGTGGVAFCLMALLGLQAFVRFLVTHRRSTDLEADIRANLRREGLMGAIEIIMHHEAREIGG